MVDGSGEEVNTALLPLVYLWNGLYSVLEKSILWLAKKRQARAYLRATISDNAKCPGCGVIERHRLEFKRGKYKADDGNPHLGAIRHQCYRCGADWIEHCVADTRKWISE
jgi:ribosomal protein L32